MFCFYSRLAPPMQIGDMSLGDNATLCLSAVIAQLAAVGPGEQIYRDVVQHIILDAVHKGLRSKTEVTAVTMVTAFLFLSNDTDACCEATKLTCSLCCASLSFKSVQHEYTTILACLVKTFPSKKEFRDLVQLANYSDPESDFFEHMKHIQVKEGTQKLTLLPSPPPLSD